MKTGLFLVFAVMVCLWPTTAQSQFDWELDVYESARAEDPVVRLQEKLDSGGLELTFDKKHGYLLSVLQHLGVSTSSQMLVFSKTSFQRPAISPRKPRALYFSEDVYVGWVQDGDVLEVASTDPKLGSIFYTLQQRKVPRPGFRRQNSECLQCHSGGLTLGVPGVHVRSVHPDDNGLPILRAGTFKTNHTSPLSERWGGWYVSGTHGREQHMGNQTVLDRERPEEFDRSKEGNVTDLSKYFDTSPYVTPHSDIVALMILEHQAHLQNLITSANYHAQRALRDQETFGRLAGESTGELSASTIRRFEHASKRLLKYLLLVEEATFRGPIVGTSEFSEQFMKRGPHDKKGRSLRDLDLSHRIFKYPCSYMIYSAAFDALPALFRKHVYGHLWEILTSTEKGADFSRLTKAQREAILEILRDTKEGLPAYWHGPRSASL